MKVIHVPYVYYPEPVGGTEVYVEGLVRELAPLGVDGVVAAPGERDAAYDHDGHPVRRFRVTPGLTDLRALYGDGDETAASAFAEILDREQPDVVHLHAFTSAVSIRLVERAQTRGLPVVFSYHTPAVSCARGTLMRWGSEVCDGVLDPTMCTACMLDHLGLDKTLSRVVARMPVEASRGLGRVSASGRAWTALRMPELIHLQQQALRTLFARADRIIALAAWVRELLVRNGVAPTKITLSRHGLDAAVTRRGPVSRSDVPLPLRLVYAGRLDAIKGVDLLLGALRAEPNLPIRLDILGVAQGASGERYRFELERIVSGDERVRFLRPVPNDEIVETLSSYDALVVPSRCLETGPLVVLEAFAAGVPVIGSALGGIRELVQDGVDGLLVPGPTPEAWRSALVQLIADHGALANRLCAGVKPPRRMSEVAADMLGVYRGAIEARATPVSGWSRG